MRSTSQTVWLPLKKHSFANKWAGNKPHARNSLPCLRNTCKSKRYRNPHLWNCIKLFQHQDASSQQSLSRTSLNRDTRMQRWESRLAMAVHTISNIPGGRKVDVSHMEAFCGHYVFLQTITHRWGKQRLRAELQCSNVTGWLAMHTRAHTENHKSNCSSKCSFCWEHSRFFGILLYMTSSCGKPYVRDKAHTNLNWLYKG